VNIAQDIEKIRLSRKLSEREMADKLGISQQVYNNIKTGRTKKVPFNVVQKAQTEFGLYEKFNADLDKEEFNQIVSDFVSQGYHPNPPMLDNKQMGTLLLLIASEVSFLSEEWKRKEKMSPDEARKLIHAQMRKIESVL